MVTSFISILSGVETNKTFTSNQRNVGTYMSINRGNGDCTYKLHASGFCPCPLQPVDLSVNKILYVQTDGLKLFLKEKH